MANGARTKSTEWASSDTGGGARPTAQGGVWRPGAFEREFKGFKKAASKADKDKTSSSGQGFGSLAVPPPSSRAPDEYVKGAGGEGRSPGSRARRKA